MKKALIIVGIVTSFVLAVFVYGKYTNTDVQLDNVNLKDNKTHKGLAVMIEQLDGTYAESDAYPTGNYMLDEKLSGCIDKNGKEIPNAISYNNGTVSFKTNSSSYCYVYFSKLTLVKYLLNEETRPSSLWTSTLDGDGYRFVGTDPGNYICFGAEDKDTCVGNTDLYMYRIIGIFEDSSGKKYVKLIKKEALNTAFAWHTSRTTDTNWGDSDLYTNLNGSYFLSNTTYSYMQNTIWADKIKDWTWSAVNTLTASNSGPNYASLTTSQAYYHEMNHAKKSSTVGSWTTPSGKIGLMYISDYFLSLGASALSYTGSSNYSTLKTGWMFLTKNDSASLSTTGSAAPSTTEWTISRYGKSSSYYYVWGVPSGGSTGGYYAYNSYSVRPVFYLNSNEEYLSGTGTSSDPFMLNGRPKYTVTINSNNDSYGEISLTSSIVYEGDTATATLNPGSIYKYSSNDCGGTASDNTLTIPNVTGNVDCTVTFVEKPKYTVNVSSNNTSYGTVSPASQTIYEGDSATITLSPKTGYIYSSDTCDGTISGNTLTVSNITSSKTCEVVFELNISGYLLNVAQPSTLEKSDLSGDGYRFVGENPNNYVCFGTNSKSACVGSPSTYLYRIIGLFENPDGVYVPKVIMSNSRYSGSWGVGASSSPNGANWSKSVLRTSLNDTSFYNDTTYVPDASWKQMILKWDFHAVTAINFSSNWNPERTGGINLANYSGEAVYKYEMNINTSSYIQHNISSDYIGIMYYSDLKLSGGWLTASTSDYERVMAAYANGYEVTGTLTAYEDCYAIGSYLTGSQQLYSRISDGQCKGVYAGNQSYLIRPSFYLSERTQRISGTGTSTDPYIIG